MFIPVEVATNGHESSHQIHQTNDDWIRTLIIRVPENASIRNHAISPMPLEKIDIAARSRYRSEKGQIESKLDTADRIWYGQEKSIEFQGCETPTTCAAKLCPCSTI